MLQFLGQTELKTQSLEMDIMLKHDSDGDSNSMAQVLPGKRAPALNRGELVKTQMCSGKQMAEFQQKSQKNQYLGSHKLVFLLILMAPVS